MAALIEDYALHRRHPDRRTGRHETVPSTGCASPDSTRGACFAALLGTEQHGRWLIAPAGAGQRDTSAVPGRHPDPGDRVRDRRRHRPASSTSCRPAAKRPTWSASSRGSPDGCRCRWSCGSGSTTGGSCRGCGARTAHWPRSPAPTRCWLRTPVETRGEDLHTVAEFVVEPGDRVPFVLTWRESHLEPPPTPIDAEHALRDTRAVLVGLVRALHLRRAMAGRRDPLADHPQGSHLRPQRRNRRRADHLAAREAGRRAELGLPLLLAAGRHLHAAGADVRRLRATRRCSWRDWLLRAIAGNPANIQIMYGVAGERRLPEYDRGLAARLRRATRSGSATPLSISSSSMSTAR